MAAAAGHAHRPLDQPTGMTTQQVHLCLSGSHFCSTLIIQELWFHVEEFFPIADSIHIVGHSRMAIETD